jgi:predicted  nucleic acid-binding Zn-ribbon protein
MDERRKAIQELEGKKRSAQEDADKLLEALGTDLLSAMENADPLPGTPAGAPEDGEASGGPGGAREEYRRLLREIADAEGTIRAIEADAGRFRDLGDEIAAREKENSENQKELSFLYTQFGQYVMADPAFNGSSDHAGNSSIVPFRSRLEEILGKISANEAKLDELEQENGGFFARIGSGAQGIVTRTLLMKNQGDLNKLYRTAGEQFFTAETEIETGEADVRELAEKIKARRQAVRAMAEETGRLKEERRELGEDFSGEGSPNRRIFVLTRQISGAKDSLAAVCRCFGAYALDPARKNYFASVLTGENKAAGGKISLLRASVLETDAHIEKIRTAIAIDSERAEIEKMKRSIDGLRRRIAEAEREISVLENGIAGAEKRIDEMERTGAPL